LITTLAGPPTAEIRHSKSRLAADRQPILPTLSNGIF